MPCAPPSPSPLLLICFFSFSILVKSGMLSRHVSSGHSLSLCSQPAGISSTSRLFRVFCTLKCSREGTYSLIQFVNLLFCCCAAQTLAESETARAVATTAREISITLQSLCLHRHEIAKDAERSVIKSGMSTLTDRSCSQGSKSPFGHSINLFFLKI
jgi:hypothetical protein